MTISFDEWNVWYHSNVQDREILGGAKGWPHAPRLLEDIYNFEDALQVGCILNTFIRRSDVVKIACIAQLVNVIAPIMTEPGGAAWRQTIFYPYFFASVYGRGEALQLTVNSPGYDFEVADNVPYLDIAGVHDEAGRTLTFFAVNRHASEPLDLELDLQGFGNARLIDHQVMTNADLEAVNTLGAPLAVAPKKGSGADGQGRAADREAAALFLPDAAPRARLESEHGCVDRGFEAAINWQIGAVDPARAVRTQEERRRSDVRRRAGAANTRDVVVDPGIAED